VIIKSPRSNGLAQKEHLRRVSRISNMRHHAIEGCEGVSYDIPAIISGTNLDNRPVPIHECG
jgi:hypothetical protein